MQFPLMALVGPALCKPAGSRCIGPQAVVHGYFEKQGGFRRTAEASGGAADGDARQLIAVFCCVIPGDKGAHAVPEKEIGKIRVFLSIYTSCFLILCLNT